MGQPFAVRAWSQRYEVYSVATGSTHASFDYTTESSRAKALGLANATRNDMNRAAVEAEQRAARAEQWSKDADRVDGMDRDDLGESPDY